MGNERWGRRGWNGNGEHISARNRRGVTGRTIEYAPGSSPNETEGLAERPIDPRELGRDRGRGGENGEERWDPLDI